MGAFDFWKTALIIHIFWAFAITLLVATIPASHLDYVNTYEIAVTTDLSEISTDLESGLTNQTNLPLIEVGALVFYSGNILLNLMLNFLNAVPQMFTLLLTAIFQFIAVPDVIQTKVKYYFLVVVSAFYYALLLAMLLNVRSGREVA